MSTNTHEAQELLRLYKCVIDTGADVLVPFAEDKLLKTYNGNFERFLDDKKHELFHLWHSKKLLCCACPPAGCTLTRTGHMDNWIFEKLYDDVGIELTGHIIRNSGKVVQMCVHKYVTRNIGIHELDTVALSFLLQKFATLLPYENTALVTIKRNRNNICHAHSPNCYDMTFLNTAWTELEKSLVDLTSPSYKGVMKKQISYLRKVNLEKEEITELLKHVQEGIKEIETLNNTAIEKCEQNLKTTVVEESLVIQQCISNGSDSMKQEIISSKSDAKESGDKILEQISILNTNQASSDLEMSKQLKQIVEMLHQINNTTFSVKYEQSKGSPEGEECLVLWQLVTPANWNAVAVEEILTRFEERFNDLPMKIKFVRNGSLVIMTTVSVEVLKESSAFQSAVKSFLTRMVEICHIDTHVSCNVDVTLHILNSNKMNLTRSLSNRPTSENKFVQTEIVETSTTPNPTVVDDESPMYGDDATFCSSCLHNYKRVVTQSYCLDCSEPICEKCGSLHTTFAPPHTITNKVNVDMKYHPSLTVSKLCSVHKNQVTNSFCTQHDALLCDVCVMDGHSSCVSVLSIQKAAKNVAEGAIMGDLENRLHNLGIVIESLITNEEKHISHANAEKEKVHKEANSIRQRISSHLDVLEREYADRLTDVAGKCKLSHKYYLPSKQRIAKILKNHFESIKTFESESEIFTALKLLDRNVSRQESAIRNFLNDIQFRRLEFNPPDIENIEMSLPNLGSLTAANASITSLDFQSQLHLVRKRKGNIVCLDSFNFDDIECAVGSGCFITGGKLLFTNFDGNNSLHILDRNGLGLIIIELNGSPLDVATYNSTIALVTIRKRGIQIINVDTNICGRYIYFGDFYAIQCENRNIWTSTGEATIYRIDIEGHILQRFEVGFVVRQIALNITGEQVFYSPLTSDRIYTLSKDGKQALFYTCLDKNTFHGLSVDCNGNVLFADTNSNCIRSISQDGKELETILSVDDGILTPDHLQMNTKTNELMVLSQGNGSIQIFKLI